MGLSNFIPYLTILSLFFGCSQPGILSASRSSIVCHVRNSEVGTIYFIKIDPVTEEEHTFSTLKLNGTDSTYAAEINYDTSEFIYLLYQDVKFRLFIENDSEIHAYFDSHRIDKTMRFSGTSSELNNYLVSKTHYYHSIILQDLKTLYSLPEDEFYSLVDSAYKKQCQLLKDLPNSAKNKPFIKIEELDIFSQRAIKQLLYPDYHYYFIKERIQRSGKSYDQINNSSIGEIGLRSENYRELISMFIDNRVKSFPIDSQLSIKDQQLAELDHRLHVIATEFSNKKISEFFAAKVLLTYLNLGLIEHFQSKYERLRERYSRTGGYLDTALDKFTALKSIAKGKAAPDFIFENLEGKQQLLSDLGSKVIFINVWSTNCHGSMTELSALKTLQQQFNQDDRIIFLNIFNNNDRNGLIEFLRNEKLSGIHGLAGGWESPFNKKYFIKTTPRYILIKNGKIVDAFAPRPSSPELLPLLSAVLNTK